TVPEWAGDHVVAVAQGGDKAVVVAVAHSISGVVADEAIGIGNDAADPSRAAAPRHRSATAIPQTAINHVVVIAQDGDAFGAHPAMRVIAHQTIRLGARTTDRRAGVLPGRRPALAVPIRTQDDVVAVIQGDQAGKSIVEIVAYLIPGFPPQ